MGQRKSRFARQTPLRSPSIPIRPREDSLPGGSGPGSIAVVIGVSGRGLSREWVVPELSADTEAAISRGLFHLGVDLLRELRHSPTDDGNVIVSPYAVASSLEELLVGATGNTADQIAAALHIPPGQRVTKYFLDRDRQIPTRRHSDPCRRFDMGYLNNVHRDQCMPTVETCTEADELLRLDYFSWDFAEDAEQSRVQIDRYLRLYAGSFKPGEILPQGCITPTSQVLLVSVVDFLGSWAQKLDHATPVSKPFYESAEETPTMVPTISQTGCFRMATCDELGATALELPYRSPASTAENASRCVSPPFGATTSSAEASWDPEFSLVILLPDEKDGLTKLMDKLSAFTLQRCLSQLKSNGQVHVSLPLFKVKQVTDLVPALSALGVSDVFTERAELWGATAGKKRVSGLRNAAAFRTAQTGRRRPWEQKRLNQKRRPVGADLAVTLAHAVYSIIKPHQQPVHFIVDRPFVFLVIHVHPDTLLLLGCVRKITW